MIFRYKPSIAMADDANLALILSSGLAATITGVTIATSCGTTAGFNCRVTDPDRAAANYIYHTINYKAYTQAVQEIIKRYIATHFVVNGASFKR